MFDNQLSFRVTGRGHSDAFVDRDFSTTASTTGALAARDRVKKAKDDETTKVIPSFHFGLGYSF